jgi:hypothetical protein
VSFSALFRHTNNRQAILTRLPTVHVGLVRLHAVSMVSSRVHDENDISTCDSLLNEFPWAGLAPYLNKIRQIEPIRARTIELAR